MKSDSPNHMLNIEVTVNMWLSYATHEEEEFVRMTGKCRHAAQGMQLWVLRTANQYSYTIDVGHQHATQQ